MDIHPNDKGYTTMVFKLTSPTLQKTLKICVGKPYDEGGRDKYNVYEVMDDNGNFIVKGLRGHYMAERGTVVMEDGDFPVMKMGEPVWLAGEVKVPLPEKKEAEVVVSKTEFVVINNVADGDCFFDAVLRATKGTPDTYSGENIGKLRNDIAEFISKDPKFRETILGKYNAYKTTKLKRMNQVEGYKEYYERVEDGEVEESVLEDLQKKYTLNEDLINSKFPDDFYPDPTQEEIIYFLTEYFNKRTDLMGDQIIDMFVQNVKEPQKWAMEDVIAAYQEMSDVQVVPLVKKGERVEDYTVNATVLKKEQLLPTTRYVFADYTPLNHFKLIARASDKKGAFLKSELPAVLQRKISESPILSRDVYPLASKTPSPLYVPEVPTMAEKPPGMVLDQGEPEPVKKPKATKPVSEQDVIKLAVSTNDGTRKLTDVPEITQADIDTLSKMKTFEAYEHATKVMSWGAYFTGKGYETFTPATLKTKQEISTVEKLVKALQTYPTEPSHFYKTKKASTEKVKNKKVD